MKTIIISTTFILALLISPVFAQKVNNYNANANAGVIHKSVYSIPHQTAVNLVKDKTPKLPSVYTNIPKPKYAKYISEHGFNQKQIETEQVKNAVMVSSKKNEITLTK